MNIEVHLIFKDRTEIKTATDLMHAQQLVQAYKPLHARFFQKSARKPRTKEYQYQGDI